MVVLFFVGYNKENDTDLKKLIILNKKEGETPLEAMGRFRVSNKEYQNIKMTYAGRLDPMASGVLLALTGEEVKNKDKYLALDKEYEFEVLFGFATDTYDILGKIIRSNIGANIGINNSKKELGVEIKKNLKYFTGKFKQKYPIYSSKTVKGKPLFEYARSGTKVKIPSREVNVKSLKFLKLKKVDNKKLLSNVEKRIKKVQGDFRQKEILKIWQDKLNNKHHSGHRVSTIVSTKILDFGSVFFIGSFKIKCSSGTYVRGIANSLGEKIGIPALTFSIKRTKIGKYKV